MPLYQQPLSLATHSLAYKCIEGMQVLVDDQRRWFEAAEIFLVDRRKLLVGFHALPDFLKALKQRFAGMGV
jgi:hypothetical protein